MALSRETILESFSNQQYRLLQFFFLDKPDCATIGIKRFSSEHRNQFYECDNGSQYAILKKCPRGQFYWPQREKCFRELRVMKHGFAFDNAFVGERPEEQPRRMTRKVNI